ncbi:SPOR domain-containing protein [Rhodoferax ferrireducens]|uniref:SPOR domain-containing protein n=1 Tax=Rhodoferax ferrireducens TaxID=192843 RepID=UPI00298DDCCF|nr:SPOR domain-containing protein [Rhodoferax ferrireducens]WPC66716.1 SPOR domain-containing protein [Rhodoferax ferrireducens]
MLRSFVLALLLINGLYFAWSQGFLQSLGLAPAAQTEPQRLARQIKPEALQVRTVQELRLTAAPPVAPKAGTCWQAGVFEGAQATLLREALVAADLPAGAWSLDPVLEPGRWIVYMGKFANAEALAKKSAELAGLKLKIEPLKDPALRPGLSLGGYETQAAANAALAVLVQRGVRTARVLPERAEVRGVMLRLPAADEALRGKLDALKPALADKALSPCP